MKRILLLLFLATITVSAKTDIEALKAHKKEYKNSIQKYKKEIQTIDAPKRVVVILKHVEESAVEEIETRFGLKLERCLVRRVCFFENSAKWEVTTLASKIKQEYPYVDTVKPYQKPSLKRY